MAGREVFSFAMGMVPNNELSFGITQINQLKRFIATKNYEEMFMYLHDKRQNFMLMYPSIV